MIVDQKKNEENEDGIDDWKGEGRFGNTSFQFSIVES